MNDIITTPSNTGITTRDDKAALIARLRERSKPSYPTVADNIPEEAKTLLAKYPSIDHWKQAYSPSDFEFMAELCSQDVSLASLDEMSKDEAPTIGLLFATYGSQAIQWMCGHLQFINVMAGTQHKMNDVQIQVFARDIVGTYPQVNLPEFARFCRVATDGHTFGPIEYAVNTTKLGAWFADYYKQINESIYNTEMKHAQENIAKQQEVMASPEMLELIGKNVERVKHTLGNGDLPASKKLEYRRQFNKERNIRIGYIKEDPELIAASLREVDPEFVKKRDRELAKMEEAMKREEELKDAQTR